MNSVEKWVSIGAGAGLVGAGAWLLKHGITRTTDPRAALSGPRGVNVVESVTIGRSLEELYRFWRNLENLPQFMRHLASVERLTDTLSRWRVKGPAGTTLEWDAEIYNDVPNKLVAWRSLEGSDVVSVGSVNFDRAAGRTRVTVSLQYNPPLGKIGDALARLFGADAATEIREDLHRFKSMVESGTPA